MCKKQPCVCTFSYRLWPIWNFCGAGTKKPHTNLWWHCDSSDTMRSSHIPCCGAFYDWHTLPFFYKETLLSKKRLTALKNTPFLLWIKGRGAVWTKRFYVLHFYTILCPHTQKNATNRVRLHMCQWVMASPCPERYIYAHYIEACVSAW